jgi:hypothetical protein
MGDRRSDSSHDGTIEEAIVDRVGVKVQPKAMKQRSSSAEAAKAARRKIELKALGEPVLDLKNREAEERASDKQESKAVQERGKDPCPRL